MHHAWLLRHEARKDGVLFVPNLEEHRVAFCRMHFSIVQDALCDAWSG